MEKLKTQSQLQEFLLRLQSEALTQSSHSEVLQKALEISLSLSGCDFAAATQLTNNHESVDILCFINSEGVLEAEEYDLLGTPCHTVVQQNDVVFFDNLQMDFNDEGLIKDLGVKYYFGMMYYIAGKPLGHLFFMMKDEVASEQIENISWMLRILSLFIGSRVELIQQSNELIEQKQAATTDSLTQLLNRRSFDHDINRALKQVEVGMLNNALLVMIDIDSLKFVNDNLGHDIGDKLIRLVSSIIKGSLRNSDLVYRLGGDEFAVLILGNAKASLERIQLLLPKWRQLINESNYSMSGLSLGAALLSECKPIIENEFYAEEPECERSKASWIKLADKRMYEDKKNKNNRG